jgi:hypothetical protein
VRFIIFPCQFQHFAEFTIVSLKHSAISIIYYYLIIYLLLISTEGTGFSPYGHRHLLAQCHNNHADYECQLILKFEYLECFESVVVVTEYEFLTRD